MTEDKDKKNLIHFLTDKKKQLILNLDLINTKLDTYRTNIHIVRYNLLENDRIKDNQLPNFDFEKANQLLNLFGDLLNGTIKDYNSLLQQILNKNTYGDVNKTSIEKSSAEELPSEQQGDKK